MRTTLGAIRSATVAAAVAATLLVAPSAPASAAIVGAPGCIERNDSVRGKVYLYSTCSTTYRVRAKWNCAGQYVYGTFTNIGPRQSKVLSGPSTYCYYAGLYING